MGDILETISTRKTPQTKKARPDQVKNAAGGFVFQASDEARLHRFLTLGTAGSTYYTSAKELTRENADVLFAAVAADPIKVVQHILDVSTAGRAPKQNPALFALAVAASCESEEGRRAALAELGKVARTGSTLFTFVKYVRQFRGWGPALTRAIAQWYNARPVDDVAYQVLKYRMREDWRHDDLLRMVHPGASEGHRSGIDHRLCGPEHGRLYNWLAATSPTAGTRRQRHGDAKDLYGEPVTTDLPALVEVFKQLKAATHKRDVLSVLAENHNVSWEMIPDQFLNEADVWIPLLEAGVPQTALIRQLPRLTNLGLAQGTYGKLIAAQLTNADRLRKARVHPVNVLVAMKTYASGHGEKGNLTWTPRSLVSDALDAAFYLAYGTVEAAGKRTLIALDVSGSMDWTNCAGLPITPRQACAAISLVTANTEPDYRVVAFTSSGWKFGLGKGRVSGWGSAISELDISPRRRLDDVTRYVGNLPAGGTDVSLPMLWAEATRTPIDTFQIYTDNETWAGAMHPYQALERYRQTMGIDAKLVVAAMTATGQSVCDPKDPRQLDVSGFDSACPQLMADFSAGRV